MFSILRKNILKRESIKTNEYEKTKRDRAKASELILELEEEIKKGNDFIIVNLLGFNKFTINEDVLRQIEYYGYNIERNSVFKNNEKLYDYIKIGV